MAHRKTEEGFTLIEALVALVVLVIGIFALYSMHTTAIKGNSTANTLSAAANIGVDAMETVIAMPFDNDDLIDDGDGCGGLDDITTPDYGPVVDGIYTYYWNVATDCYLTGVPATTDQRPKHVRVIVERDIRGIKKRLTFDYIKQSNI